MSCTMNGHHMSIGYGEAGTVSDTLSIGRNYCHRHLSQIPRLTKEEVRKLGGIFPPPSPPLPHEIVKRDGVRFHKPVEKDETEAILKRFDDGDTIAAISRAMKRAPMVVRAVLLRHKRNTSRYRFTGGNPLRPRITELIRAGKPFAEIVTETGAALSYVRAISSSIKRAERQAA